MFKSKLDFTFGKLGFVLGCIVLISGIYFCFNAYIVGITNLIVGSFLAFSKNICIIDFNNKRVKYSSNIFGLIKIGYWIDVKDDMLIVVKGLGKSKSGVEGNEIYKEYKISLFNPQNVEILVLFKSKRIKEINDFADELKSKFNLTVAS